MQVETVPDADQLRDHWWWRPGWGPGSRMLTWQLTFEDESELHQRAGSVQRALAGIPALDPVPAEWLHLTLATVGSTTDVTDDCVRQLINAAHAHVAEIPEMPLTFRRLVVFAESVVLIPDPSPSLGRLHSELLASVREVRGEHAPAPAAAFVPHLSVAYANGPSASADVASALVTPAVAPVIDVHPTLSLVEMYRVEHGYRWRAVSSFPL